MRSNISKAVGANLACNPSLSAGDSSVARDPKATATRPQEIIISPFPGAIAVYQYDPSEEPELRWPAFVIGAIALACLLLLYLVQ